MFREMRRKRQLLTEEESVLILQRMTSVCWLLAGMTDILMLCQSVMCIMKRKFSSIVR